MISYVAERENSLVAVSKTVLLIRMLRFENSFAWRGAIGVVLGNSVKMEEFVTVI